MIPPLTVVQPSDDQRNNMVGWLNTFNMRQVTLTNIANSQLASGSSGINFSKSGCIKSPTKSLDILRKNLQKAINKDIETVLRKYIDKFFQPAINNIKMNLGSESIDEETISNVCRNILEEAKKVYVTSHFRDSCSPYENSDSDASSVIEIKNNTSIPFSFKRKEFDTEFEGNAIKHINKRHKSKPKLSENNFLKDNFKQETIKWTADRINEHTLFIMGAKANKVLGFGQTRGRLYIKHPDLIRYQGDQEDKDWLASKNLMPPSGGKAYIMLFDDIRELTLKEEYRNSPSVQLQELKGFEAPKFMLQKIKEFLHRLQLAENQNHGNLSLFELQNSQFVNNLNNPNNSNTSTPSSTLQMLDLQIANNEMKRVETGSFIQISDSNPESKTSFLSVSLSQNPLHAINVGSNVLVNVISDITNNLAVTSSMSCQNTDNS